jgi:hypothetical protein
MRRYLQAAWERAMKIQEVLGASIWGFLAREWKGIRGLPIHIQQGALVVLVAAMFTLGLASGL